MGNISYLQIIIIAIVGGVILFLIIFLIFKLTFGKRKLKKEVYDLESSYEYHHSLLIGTDAQNIKRLEIISRTNLLYGPIYDEYNSKFKEVRDKYDSSARSSINQLKDFCSEKRYKALKQALGDAKDCVDEFKKQVSDLSDRLLAQIKPEEECRTESLVLKEKLRGIKQEYYQKQSELSLVNSSFDEIFAYLDNQFAAFEKDIESANYEDATEILPRIDKVLNEIKKSMVELPNLCATVISYVPDKIASLENAYEIMTRDKYNLSNLLVPSSIHEMKSRVDFLTKKIKKFNFKGVEDELDDIASRCEEFMRLFEEEREARVVFERDNADTYASVNNIENRFIKMCNVIPEVNKYFLINEENQKKIDEIQNNVNKLGALKRSLDTFIHGGTIQPYSMLVNKMTELSDANKNVITAMDEFDKYVASLKEDSENAYRVIREYSYKVKDAEKTLHEINIEAISKKYEDKIKRCYEILSAVNTLLNTLPINIDETNKYIADLHSINNDLFDNGAISDDHRLMLLAKNAILSANMYRRNLSDHEALLEQAESLFNEGEFDQSYNLAANVLKDINEIEQSKDDSR